MSRAIKDLLREILPLQNSWKVELLHSWEAIVGTLKDKVKVEKILDDGTIIVGVTNSAWMQEVYFLSDLLLKKINTTLAQAPVKQLRFRYSPPSRKQMPPNVVARAKQKSERALSAAETRALGRIIDEELREGLRRFLIRCHSEGESYENSLSGLAANQQKYNYRAR